MAAIINNEETKRFEITTIEAPAFLEYDLHNEDMILIHTFVSEKLRGHGLAGELAEFALQHIRKNKLKAVVECPYVADYLKHHPEHKDIIKAISVKNKE